MKVGGVCGAVVARWRVVVGAPWWLLLAVLGGRRWWWPAVVVAGGGGGSGGWRRVVAASMLVIRSSAPRVPSVTPFRGVERWHGAGHCHQAKNSGLPYVAVRVTRDTHGAQQCQGDAPYNADGERVAQHLGILAVSHPRRPP